VAVDSKQKRFQMLSFGDADAALLPENDAEFTVEDRAHLIWLYGGIALGEPVIVDALPVGHKGTKKRLKPRLKPISQAQRQRDWKEKVTAADLRMSRIHASAARALRKAVESERPTESVEARRAKTRTHKKRGLEVQKPQFEKQEQPQGIPPKQPKKTVRRIPTAEERLKANRDVLEQRAQKQVAQEKRAALEDRIEKQMVAAEQRERKDAILAKEQAWQQKKRALVNLEFAKEAKAKKQAVEDARNKQRAKALRKARAAKKRKAKKRKKK